MLRFANAVDIMGVWSEKSLPTEDLTAMRELSVVPGTQSRYDDDKKTIDLWTLGARSACQRLRLFIQAFIDHEEKCILAERDPSIREGQEAMIKACQVVL